MAKKIELQADRALPGQIYGVKLPIKKLKNEKLPEISPYGDTYVWNLLSKPNNFLFHKQACQGVPKKVRNHFVEALAAFLCSKFQPSG